MFSTKENATGINFVFMTPGEKFTQALESSAFTKAEFARLMGVKDQDIQNWMSRGIPKKVLFAASRYLGKDPEWLLLDDEDLPTSFTPEELDLEVRATALFELLSEEQRQLIGSLIVELARK